MHINRQQLQEIERSLRECARHTADLGKTMPLDGRDRRDNDTDLARATEVLADIRGMLNAS